MKLTLLKVLIKLSFKYYYYDYPMNIHFIVSAHIYFQSTLDILISVDIFGFSVIISNKHVT